MNEAKTPLLQVRDLTVTFGSGRHKFTAVNKVSFQNFFC